MKTILVPVDGSTSSTPVCKAACALAKFTNSKIELLHASEPPPNLLTDYSFDADLVAEALEAEKTATAKMLRRLASHCERSGVATTVTDLTGPRVATIVARSSELKPAYIVIGSHGQGAVYNLLAGSTTQGVLRQSLCPVLVVPTVPPAQR